MPGLCYCSASAGGFGLVNFSLRLPQSHVMLVGPQSCGRHTSLGAFMRGYEDRNSYLFLDEADICLGTVDDLIVDAVQETLDVVKARPRVFIVMLTCLPFIEGVDERALVDRLSSIHHDIAFQVFLMNPVSAGTNRSPGKVLYSRIAELWDTSSEQDGSMNIVGSVIPPAKDSEIYKVSEACGITSVNHIGSSEDYDAFRRMGRAKWNLLLKSDCRTMAEELYPRMGYMFSPVSYEPDVIRGTYEEMFKMVGGSTDLDVYEEKARATTLEASSELKGLDVAIGSSATMRAFGMARFLLSNGIRVTDVLRPDPEASPPPAYDAEAARWVKANAPGVRYHDPSDVGFVREVGKAFHADLAIGYDAAYFSDAKHVLGFYDDAGMYGFHGTETFMKGMVNALDRERDLIGMLYDARLVI